MYGYIYITENLINGKKYIGQKKSTKFLKTKYLGSGAILQKAIKKYGKENFKVTLICECNSKEELDEKEIYYIAEYDAQNNPNFYNLTKGGESGLGGAKFKGHKHTEQSRKQISESLKGEKNPFFGQHHTEKTRKHLKEKWKTRPPISDETRLKLSKARKGRKFTEEHKRKISEAQKGEKGNNWGKKLSADTKNKISNTVSNQVWMNDGTKCYRINKEYVNEYLEKGYKLGRLHFKKGSTTIES